MPTAGPYMVKLVVTTIMDVRTVYHTVDGVFQSHDYSRQDTSICRGKTVRLRTTGAQTYQWSPAQASKLH